jgi:hypothetical protein
MPFETSMKAAMVLIAVLVEVAAKSFLPLVAKGLTAVVLVALVAVSAALEAAAAAAAALAVAVQTSNCTIGVLL